MVDKWRTALLAIMVAAVVAGPALAQVYSGAGAGAPGSDRVQVAGGGVSAGPGGVRTFTLGGGYMYSITSVGPDDVQRLQAQGVRVIVAPAGKMIHVTSQTGQPLDIRTGDQGVVPNVLVFGPGGFAGTGVMAAGPGTGAWAGAGPGAGTGVFISPGSGVSISAVPGAGASVQIGGGAGVGGVSISAGQGTGATQAYSFTGSPGQAYLITQQAGGTVDRVLVMFQ